MFHSLVRHFSRVTSFKTRTKNIENIINVADDVKFYKKDNNTNSNDVYLRESSDIDRVFSDKFLRNGRKKKIDDLRVSQEFKLNYKRDSESSDSFSIGKSKSHPKSNESTDELCDYNFKVEPDEFFEYDKFESLKKNPRYQDLSHEERQYLQELEVKSKLKDPFNTLKTNKAKVDPVRDAKRLLRETSQEENDQESPEYNIELIGESEDTHYLDKRLVEQNKFDEVVSRIRNKIRMEKKQNSEINNLKIPNVNGIVLDPIRKHVLRRAARIGTMLHTHIEQLFTCNDPEFLYKYLNGASISINHVEMPTSKSTVKCYYNILSNHDPKQVQRNLDLVSSKVRFMIARKLELGYTPPIKFIKYNRSEFANVKRRSQLLQEAFNLPLEVTSELESGKLLDVPHSEHLEDKICIRNDQITPEMNREIQESFHRRFCGYP